MSTRKTRAKKDEIQKGAGSRQSKSSTSTRAATGRTKSKTASKTKEKIVGKRASTADPQAQVKPSRRGISGKRVKGIESKEYRQSPKASRSDWEDTTGQIHTHNPGRIYNEQNTRGLGVKQREQNERNISGEQFYEHGSGMYGDSDRYRTSPGQSQYPPFDREGYNNEQDQFRDEFNYNDSYWWEGQFPQGASWEGDGRWQHHARAWTHRQNQQGERYNLPYGGDYEKYRWMQNRNRPQHSEDYNEGRSRGNMTWGEAVYPPEQRMREDIYQDPGSNYDQQGTGYRMYRSDRGDDHPGGGWTARDEYRHQGNDNYNDDRERRQRDEEYHSRSTDMRDRIMDYLEEAGDRNSGHMRTVWTNTLDTPYEGGYNIRTSQTNRRAGTGGYNQGGYGAQGYSYEYGNAGGYGSTGSYQGGHRGEHRRGGYNEGLRYAERQDELKGRNESRNYSRDYIVGSDEDRYRELHENYHTRMNDHYEDDPIQQSGNIHGIKRYGEGEGNKWKDRG